LAKTGSLKEAGVSPMKEVHKFLDDCREISHPGRLGLFIVTKYKEVFKEEPPNAALVLIKAKISYRLQYVGMKSAGLEISKKFMSNYEAAQKLELNGFDEDAKFLMELSLKQEQKQKGENTVAKVNAKAKAPAKPQEKKPSTPKLTRAELLAKAEKMGLKNRRAMNLTELAEVTAPGVSKEKVAEILKKAVARWRSGLSSSKKAPKKK
jgi:hypothetical protein